MYTYTENQIIKGRDVWKKDAFDYFFEQYQKTGNESLRKALIESHISCVIEIVGHYYPKGIVERDDLINAGNIGLMKAFEAYDPSKGKFITYATPKIRQAIGLELKNFGTEIRVSTHEQAKSALVQKQKGDHYKRYGRKPTIEELARDTHKSVADIEEALFYSSYEILSLNAPRDNEVSEDHHEYAGDPRSLKPFEVVDARTLVEEIFEESKLSAREEDILWKTIGLGMSNPHVGSTYHGVTDERIRQISGEALEKIKGAREKMLA